MKIFDTKKGLFKMTMEAEKKGTLSSIPFILISPLLSLIPGIVVGLLLAFTIGYSEEYLNDFFQFNLLQYTSGAILIYYLIAEFKEKRSFFTLGLPLNKNIFLKYLIGFLIGIIMLSVIALTIVSLGCGKISFNKINTNFSDIISYIYVLISWIILGASEEIMVRGYMFPSIAVKKGVIFSILLTSIYFGLIHITGKGVNFIAIFNLSLFGILDCLYAIYEESIWGVCALHAAWNFCQGNIFGFIVSGDIVGGGSLFKTGIIDVNIINGGIFGPEASIITTIVIIIAIVIILVLQRKKYNKEE
ncbi:CPBP family intramembrane glutamic endopeptidase [Clostridium tarantellae]|uniref:CPBP family intramembrane metalloprotease n=1 Tax=Clostridium tarantellae TaxID=39493 RepID=A0A6I1MNX8_9CLOT|nr:type II CAAX endopeptidase family protein [Clostridium tarantellae]MPQ44483.1 CPBP family intramembrane metalloprotease [Clostridium tarantellae]